MISGQLLCGRITSNRPLYAFVETRAHNNNTFYSRNKVIFLKERALCGHAVVRQSVIVRHSETCHWPYQVHRAQAVQKLANYGNRPRIGCHSLPDRGRSRFSIERLL